MTAFGQAPRLESLKIFKNKKDVEVLTIYQDLSGYLWLGTSAGLVRYDGVEFESFAEDAALSQSVVTCMVSDTNGDLWFGHKNGIISIFDGKIFSLFEPEEGLGSREVSSLFVDDKGIVWFTTLGEGVYYFTGEHRKRLYNLNVDDGLLDNYVYTIVQDSLGTYYLGTDKGISIYHYCEKEFTGKISMANGLPDNIVKKLWVYNDNLWIGMEDAGICKYNLPKKEFYDFMEWDFGSMNNFSFINESEIWVSTKRKGVVKCQYRNNKISYSSYKKDNGLADIRTRTIFNDREGNLWIGSKKGLSVRRNTYIEFFNKEAGFSIEHIFSITMDVDHNLWVASQEGLFVVSQNQNGKLLSERLFNEPEFEFATFVSLYADADGNIWTGTYGMGVFKINAKTKEFKRYTTNEGLSNNNIIHITGNEKQIWFSSLGGGVSVMDLANERKFTTYSMEQGLTSNYVYHTYLQENNTAWLATDGGGVVKIENGRIFPFSDQLMDSIGKVVYSIAGNDKSVLWFNIADYGLVKFDGEKCTHFTELNHLASNSIQSILMNNYNELVLASNQGIGLLSCANMEVRNIGERYGVAYQEPNLNTVFKDDNNNVYIGTTKGIIKLLSHSPFDEVEPKLRITNTYLFSDEIDMEKKVFKHNENYLSFDFTALIFSSPEGLVYRFKLNGFDLDWRSETNSRTFSYPELSAGEYVFEVQVKLPNGEWHGTKEATYSFRVKPPFWKTTLFIVLAVAFGILVVYLFVLFRIRKLKRDKEILEQEVVKRTAEINLQKKEIENQRDEIEVQHKQVLEQHNKIEIQNKDITSSIHYASRIQNAVLPPLDSFKNIVNDYFLFFRPRDIVSGDFYYLNTKYNKTIIAAADCTGHGVPGAFMSILGVSLLNQIVGQLKEDFNAATILTELRCHVKTSLRQTGKHGEAKDGMDISLCIIDEKTEVVQFAGAFNPLFIVRNKEQIIYKGDKMPIGVYLVEEDSFTNHEVPVQKGDMLYIYSDGFQDQFGGEKKRKFLPKRMRQLLLDNSHLELKKQEEELDKAFLDWKGDEHQVDDILVIGIRI